MDSKQIAILVAAALVLIAVTVFVCRYIYMRKAENKVKYMLDALSDGELNFRFHETGKQDLNSLLNQLKAHFDTDISNMIEDNEAESWSKLIRVLTHEIMNTVTPISTLSDALKDAEPQQMKEGLETISASSKNLIQFVQSYRDLTRIPTPVRKALMVKDLAETVISLTSEQASETGAQIHYIEKSPDILIYADESQISRILINLIRNALQAGATKVDIIGEIDAMERVNIYVANNGPAISEENQKQIFVPFFTTKSDGSGIGLSVSRQIMRLHGGSLRLLRSTPASDPATSTTNTNPTTATTIFALTFK